MSARTATSPTSFWYPRFKPIAPLFAAVFGLLMLAGIAIAQDPPGRVGRLSDVAGGVFLTSDDSSNGWQPVGINYPITLGDNIWVSADARAEVDYGGGQLRLAREANVHFTQLDERVFSAFLANGRASLHLRMLDPGEVSKLDTPNAQIDLLRPGTYRLDTAGDSGYTMLAVREGEAEMQVGERRVVVLSGQTATVQGSGFGAAVSIRDGVGTDGFDQYALDRDRRLESRGPAEQYVSSFVPGVADLNTYGTWSSTPYYGAVWYPTSVAPDWVPYQDGSWTYVQPWGWTWVDNAPWGWVPFHYGRWVRIGPRWAWTPGEYHRRPVYAPALVAWFGGASGTSWSIGAGRPTYGWVPLAWGEPYWPHYRHSTEYWRRQNQYVNVDVRRMPQRAPQRFNYVNARIPGAVMAARAEVLIDRRPVRSNHFNITPQQIAAAPQTTAPLSVRPAPRSNIIDKGPDRAPEPAGAYATRVRPDLRGQNPGGVNPGTNFGGRGPDQGAPVRPGIGAAPSAGPVAPTPATPLPMQPIQPTPQPGAVQPSQPGQPGGGRPGMGQQGGGRPSVNDPSGGRGPAPAVQTPGVQPPPVPTPMVPTPGAMGGRPYNPDGRPQQGVQQPSTMPQQPPIQPAPRPSVQPQPTMQPEPSMQPPPRPRPGSPRDAPVMPQSPPSLAPAPQSAPMPMMPSAVPQPLPQQPMPQRPPMQRVPAPMPVAPAPSSIAPAPAPMVPAPSSMAPSRPVPQQPQPLRPGESLRPGEVPPVQPPAPMR